MYLWKIRSFYLFFAFGEYVSIHIHCTYIVYIFFTSPTKFTHLYIHIYTRVYIHIHCKYITYILNSNYTIYTYSTNLRVWHVCMYTHYIYITYITSIFYFTLSTHIKHIAALRKRVRIAQLYTWHVYMYTYYIYITYITSILRQLHILHILQPYARSDEDIIGAPIVMKSIFSARIYKKLLYVPPPSLLWQKAFLFYFVCVRNHFFIRPRSLAFTLQHTATHRNTLQQPQHTATHCNTLHHTTTHCNTLHHTAPHCRTLQHTATHCHPLQHTATHCNTLQHTATHCNKPPIYTHTLSLALCLSCSLALFLVLVLVLSLSKSKTHIDISRVSHARHVSYVYIRLQRRWSRLGSPRSWEIRHMMIWPGSSTPPPLVGDSMYIHIHVCVYICIHVSICMYIYVYTYEQKTHGDVAWEQYSASSGRRLNVYT